MKYLMAAIIVCAMQVSSFGHCGTCSVGKSSIKAKSHHHDKASMVKELKLNERQEKAFGRINDDFNEKMKSLKSDYMDRMKKIMDKKQFKKFES